MLNSINAMMPDSAMIETKDYRVYYQAETATVVMEGFLRLNGIEAYQPVMDLLGRVLKPFGIMVAVQENS
jgi:hypothetical protein